VHLVGFYSIYKMERVGDREAKMERYCSTGQSPQRAVAPTEEEVNDDVPFAHVTQQPVWRQAVCQL
jgi:hypothetical protein